MMPRNEALPYHHPMAKRIDGLGGGVVAQEPDNLIDQLPDDVLDRLPDDVIGDLRDGVIDKIPEDLVDQLPTSVTDRIPDGLLESASADPLLAAILIGVGALAVLVFLFGVFKSAFKAAFLAAVVGGGAWIWYFSIQ